MVLKGSVGAGDEDNDVCWKKKDVIRGHINQSLYALEDDTQVMSITFKDVKEFKMVSDDILIIILLFRLSRVSRDLPTHS